MKKLLFLLRKLPYDVTVYKNNVIKIKNSAGWVVVLSPQKGAKNIINFVLSHNEAEISKFRTKLSNQEKLVEIVSLYLGLYNTALSLGNSAIDMVSTNEQKQIAGSLTAYVVIFFQVDNIKEKIKKISV